MSSPENQPDPNDVSPATPEVGEQFPVYLDDDALESMTGETLDAGGADENDDAARLGGSDVGSGKAEKSRRRGGIGWFKALFLFLFAQFLLLLMVAAVFRKPLTQAYDHLVERGYVKPGALPWQSGGVAAGEMAASVGDVEWEDVRLRHELTLLADAAIARGDRGALNELQAALDVAEDPVRRASARAEMFRVQQMYATASRLPGEPLAVAQLFPGARSEGELTEEQIVSLLTDPDRAPEVRIRAAWLLRGHRTMRANDQLMIAVRNDQNLDVVKEAMLSFQSNTGYQSGDWFDANAAEDWWARNASRLAKEFAADKEGEKPATPAVDPEPAPPSSDSGGAAPSAGATPPKATVDPPAAPSPSADGPPERKNLRPLPPATNESEGSPAESGRPAGPDVPSAGGDN